MRRKTILFLASVAVIFMMAGNGMPFFVHNGKQLADTTVTAIDTLLERADTAGMMSDEDKALLDSMAMADREETDTDTAASLLPDTTKMDSLELAVYRHNKAVDDSIRADSIFRSKQGGIDAPVSYEASDSLVYDAVTKTAHLYGDAKVNYTTMELESEKVYMSLDSSIVHATGVADSTGKLTGTPVFKMGTDTYENDTMAFNFKTKKGLISNVYTQQEDGFLRSERAKRDSSGALYLTHGRYTTCDEEHPDFYIALSRAKVRPGKDVVFGPAYLVVADVPLPLAIPYGFFPFTKSYSSGFIMPSYGDESTRGFYLSQGGYYFAMSDKWDLKILGDIYTKGSWMLSAASNYNKRYRYSGSVYVSYQNTKTGDKGMPDYVEEESYKFQWQHRQDPKANPYTTLTASVNFSSISYDRNNMYSLYNPQMLSQSLRTSSVGWTTNFSSLGLSLNGTANLEQNMRDSSITVGLPDLTITVSKFYPFRRKKMVGDERWYEKISMRYTGHLKNSIKTQESKLFHTNLIKDWTNGFEHQIPIEATFSLFNVINLTPHFDFNDHMTFKKERRSWDQARQVEVRDTTYGFYNKFDWRLSLSANTKIYGRYIPNRKIFGDKIQAIRHVFTPQVTFSYTPDFSTKRYGYYASYQKTDADGNVSLVQYSPYEGGMFSAPRKGMSGSIMVDISNNVEMKIKSDKDISGIKKISIIDELGANMSYDMAAKEKPWSDLNMRIRLKLTKSYTFSMNAQFATYAWDVGEDGVPYETNYTEYSRGRFGRFQGTTQNISFTLTPEKLKNLFKKKKSKDDEEDDDDKFDTGVESNIDETMEKGKHGAEGKGKAETDEDGYMKFSLPWSLSIGYGISMNENRSGTFNAETKRWPYSFTQNLNFSGNVRLSEGWNINFSSGYDFNYHQLSMTRASLARDLHCFSMTCEVVLYPYTSYNFTFRCNASTLTDALKYDKRSGYTNSVQWY